MSRQSVVIAGLVLIALTAAGTLAATAMSSDEPSEPRTYTSADDGAAIELAPGETVTISLPGNPTTGYAWQPAGATPAAVSVSEPAYTSDSDLIGSGGTFTFTVTGSAPGEAVVHLAYVRPWEDVEPLETFTLTITVG